MDLPLAVQPRWRSHYDLGAKWISEGPPGICKECGAPFSGVATRRWCSDECRRRARSRSGSHAGRTRRRARLDQGSYAKYDIVGKFELHDAFRGRCGYCAKPIRLDEILIGHVTGVREGGQHTRANIAPIHATCEAEWNVISAS